MSLRLPIDSLNRQRQQLEERRGHDDSVGQSSQGCSSMSTISSSCRASKCSSQIALALAIARRSSGVSRDVETQP